MSSPRFSSRCRCVLSSVQDDLDQSEKRRTMSCGEFAPHLPCGRDVVRSVDDRRKTKLKLSIRERLRHQVRRQPGRLELLHARAPHRRFDRVNGEDRHPQRPTERLREGALSDAGDPRKDDQRHRSTLRPSGARSQAVRSRLHQALAALRRRFFFAGFDSPADAAAPLLPFDSAMIRSFSSVESDSLCSTQKKR